MNQGDTLTIEGFHYLILKREGMRLLLAWNEKSSGIQKQYWIDLRNYNLKECNKKVA